MKFRCEAKMILDIIDLPRTQYRILPDPKIQMVLVFAGILIVSIVWGVF
jgi:hypothetical protein